ncbi:hypothetical protein [Changchengzhania lutea]|uniref:hypothetical protein n=1 Tax=Changchengzhania lutea TaxID=2049305 RepID=UPI00115C7EEA|nr:hypothetical protein [Changchengzhania lutea]
MVILKKIEASSLMETLVATVLIVVVFMIASMILNNLFSNTIKTNTRVIDAKLNEIEYLFRHDKIQVPFYDDYKSWEIAIEHNKNKGQNSIRLEAKNTETNKTILKEISAN